MCGNPSVHWLPDRPLERRGSNIFLFLLVRWFVCCCFFVSRISVKRVGAKVRGKVDIDHDMGPLGRKLRKVYSFYSFNSFSTKIYKCFVWLGYFLEYWFFIFKWLKYFAQASEKKNQRSMDLDTLPDLRQLWAYGKWTKTQMYHHINIHKKRTECQMYISITESHTYPPFALPSAVFEVVTNNLFWGGVIPANSTHYR